MARGPLVCGIVWGLLLGSTSADDGQLAGQVLDAAGEPVPRTCVIAFDHRTGAPFVRGGFREASDLKNLLVAVTDDQGEFSITDIAPGIYKLIAQTWDAADTPVRNPLLEQPNDSRSVVRLRGVVEKIEVPSPEATRLQLRPLGNASLVVITDPKSGNPDTLLAISRDPLAADPALGLAGWVGPFSTNLIAGNRMPYGKTIIHGLPEGKLHVATFAPDNLPGFGGATVDLKAGKKTNVAVRFVAPWSDGYKEPPQELAPLVNQLRRLGTEEVKALVKDQLPDVIEKTKQTDGDAITRMSRASPFLNHKITLPDGKEVLYKDFAAARGYMALKP